MFERVREHLYAAREVELPNVLEFLREPPEAQGTDHCVEGEGGEVLFLILSNFRYRLQLLGYQTFRK